MTLPSRFWADLSTRDFARMQASGAAERTVAVLPVAAIEQHGPHLPMSVDTTLVDGVIAACLPHLPEALETLFLPTQAVGKSDEHLKFPGTLSLSAETLIRVWTEIGESVARAGVRKLVLLNSHGGQLSVMDIVARDLRCRCNLIVYSTNWFSLPLGEGVQSLFSAQEHRFGIHAGDVETSMMLALRPQFVAMDQARDFRSTSQDRAETFPILGNGTTAKLGWQMQDYNPMGAAGNATLATEAKGRAVLEAAGAQLAQLLQEVARLPLSTLVDQAQIPL
ncbi:MAG TPA: creatininase family protein [Ramlibacter sp.]|nr:creatininase family protein [Ramlibacter sp.]